MFGEEQLLAIHGIDDHITICQAQGRLHRIKETGPNPSFVDETVDHNLDVVHLILFQFWHF